MMSSTLSSQSSVSSSCAQDTQETDQQATPDCTRGTWERLWTGNYLSQGKTVNTAGLDVVSSFYKICGSFAWRHLAGVVHDGG